MAGRDVGTDFQPKYDANGLITAFVTDLETGEALMLAYMNEQALRLTLETQEAHFYSRSRSEIWHKGGTSGNVLVVHDVRIDCDQDAIWLVATAKGHGAACHTGRKSCFYREVRLVDGALKLEMSSDELLFDPNEIYGA